MERQNSRPTVDTMITEEFPSLPSEPDAPSRRGARSARGSGSGTKDVSAFFISTADRADKSAFYNSGNTLRMVSKTVLLVLNICLVVYLTDVAQGGPLHHPRRALVCLFSVLFVARVLTQMFVFWHRRITHVEVWFEAAGVIPLTLVSFAWGAASGASDATPLGVVDAAGCTIFLAGTWLNLWPEYSRHVWKKDKANKGRLYTQGAYQYCRRVNYSGEILSFVGFALVTGPGWSFYNQWVPAVMFVAMGAFSTPEIEHYLANRYQADWSAYAKRVKWKMVPGVW